MAIENVVMAIENVVNANQISLSLSSPTIVFILYYKS